MELYVTSYGDSLPRAIGALREFVRENERVKVKLTAMSRTLSQTTFRMSGTRTGRARATRGHGARRQSAKASCIAACRSCVPKTPNTARCMTR